MMARERLALLDHDVTLLIEDGWRNPWSTDPLRPSYRGKPYPMGKQARAYVRNTTVEELLATTLLLPGLQGATRCKIAAEVREADAIMERRLRAAREPLAVIEPQSSLPGPQRTVMELEKRCRMPIEAIRACFRQGRRSVEQQELRDQVEDVIRAMVKHYRMRHPHHGSAQLEQQRAVWREYAGSKNWGQRDMATFLWAFGDVDDDGMGEVEGGVADTFSVHRASMPRRAPRSQNGPQVVPALCSALGVSGRTLERVIRRVETSPRTTEIIGSTSHVTEGSR